jgi:hypothetical protein
MNVNNEKEFHEDNNEQTQEEDTPVSSVFNAHSYLKKTLSDSSKAPRKSHQKQTTKNNHSQKQVYINTT